MTTKASMPLAVLAAVVDSLKEQVHSAVDVFCTEALQTNSDLSGDGCDGNVLETAIVTLSTLLHQLKDEGNLSSTDPTETNLSSKTSSLNTPIKEAEVNNETNSMLLSRINKLEQSMLELVQKGDQMEQRQKVLDETLASKKEFCDLQYQLASRMCSLETSSKKLDLDVKSRFIGMSKDIDTYKQRLQDLEKTYLDNSESMDQELNKVMLMNKDFNEKMVNVKNAMSSIEADVRILTGNVSHVKMSETEKKISCVGDRMSDIELKTCDLEEKLKTTELSTKNQVKMLKTKTDQLTHLIEKKVNNLESLKVVLNRLNDRTTERAEISTKLDQTEQKLSQLSQTVGKLHHTMSSPPIAFCARIAAEDKNVVIEENQILDKFSTLFCNAGNSLDASDGIFRAPRDGLYTFASWIEKATENDVERIEVAITRTRNVSGSKDYIGYLPLDSCNNCTSFTCIVRLKTGDKVFMEVTNAYEGARLTWASTFAGWLIR